MSTPNWHQKHVDGLSRGDRVSDAVAQIMGSWKFIFYLTIFIGVWIIANAIAWALRWDPFPFILLNLFFSAQATYATPIILMAQNRAAQRDKIQAEHQYEHNDKAIAENTALTKAIHELTLGQSAILAKLNDTTTK